jgi:hypothetical protein
MLEQCSNEDDNKIINYYDNYHNIMVDSNYIMNNYNFSENNGTNSDM